MIHNLIKLQNVKLSIIIGNYTGSQFKSSKLESDLSRNRFKVHGSRVQGWLSSRI